jgi:NCS1 family nucleobase:cation symporter-1
MLAAGEGAGFGDIIQASTNLELVEESGGYLYVFLGGLTANIAFWATMALSIPDFSRYAQTQKAQFMGQIYGLPIMMAICAFVGAYFAQATKLVFGVAMFDPTEVFNYLSNPFIIILVSIGVIIATLTTNTAANVLAPANVFSNLAPKKITYTMGVIATLVICIAFRPWWIFGGAGAYIFSWLNTYGAILAPIAAVFAADYYIVKKTRVDVVSLFKVGDGTRYWYSGGFNIKALIAWFCGAILPVVGGSVEALKWVAANGYFVGFAIGFVVYVLLMRGEHPSYVSEEEMTAMTERS